MYADGGGDPLDLHNTAESFETFNLKAGGVSKFVSRTGNRGYLELQALTGGPIFLFRGSLTAAECEAELKGERVNFALGAAVGQASQMKLEENPGEFTVFSTKESLGFVRIIQC